MTGGLNVFLQVKCFFYKSDYGSRRASQYRITTHLGVRVNVKEIGMTDKKEAVLLKINQINVELDSLIGGNTPGNVTSLNCDLGPWPRVDVFC